MTKSYHFKVNAARSRARKNVWTYVLEGAAVATDPIPRPPQKIWHHTAEEAFASSFWTLSCTRNQVISYLAKNGLFHDFNEMVPVGSLVYAESARKAKETA